MLDRCRVQCRSWVTPIGQVNRRALGFALHAKTRLRPSSGKKLGDVNSFHILGSSWIPLTFDAGRPLAVMLLYAMAARNLRHFHGYVRRHANLESIAVGANAKRTSCCCIASISSIDLRLARTLMFAASMEVSECASVFWLSSLLLAYLHRPQFLQP